MKLDLFHKYPDFSKEKVMIGLSAGINSMAVLIYLSQFPDDKKPKNLFVFYAHLKEHSDDSFRFVADGIRYARKHFENVHVKITRNSVIEFFRKSNMIPHPMFSPCTRVLKLIPMTAWAKEMGVTVDLIGYVREEKNRIKKQYAKMVLGNKDRYKEVDLSKALSEGSTSEDGIIKYYPLFKMTNNQCFEYVKRHIGWYPAIYDIKKKVNYKKGPKAVRVFKHNNCLPCKNMDDAQLRDVENFFPEKAMEAKRLSDEIGQFWGRMGDGFCEVCTFD